MAEKENVNPVAGLWDRMGDAILLPLAGMGLKAIPTIHETLQKTFGETSGQITAVNIGVGLAAAALLGLAAWPARRVAEASGRLFNSERTAWWSYLLSYIPSAALLYSGIGPLGNIAEHVPDILKTYQFPLNFTVPTAPTSQFPHGEASYLADQALTAGKASLIPAAINFFGRDKPRRAAGGGHGGGHGP